MLKVFLLALIAVAAAEKVTFNGYKVFRIIPTKESQIEALREMENSPQEYDFWNGPTFVNRTVDVMVAPHKMPDFIRQMRDIDAKFEIYVNNVQSLINREQISLHGSNFFNNYHNLEEIYDYLEQLAQQHPDKIEVVVGGKSYEGREIKGVKVTFNPSNPGIFIEGGIHAREWISPATVLYILDQLLHSENAEVQALAERHNWFIFPVFNPDGYAYTFSKDRLWRKTRKPYGLCHGADPNRNFDFKWNQGGSSRLPCSETYGGSSANSEIEIKTISSYIESVKDEFYAYISFHSYSQLLLFPYGHTTERVDNYDDLYAIGKESINALAKRYGTKYITGSIAEAIYIATGNSVDWVRGVLNKPLSYTYELRDTGRYGFVLPTNQIIPTGEETLDSLVAMFKKVAELDY